MRLAAGAEARPRCSSMRAKYSSQQHLRPPRVDVAVREVVEPQHLPQRGRLDAGAVVARVALAHAVAREQHRERGQRDHGDAGRAAAAQRHAHRHPEGHHEHARAERDRARRELPEQHEAGQQRAAERPERPDRRQPAHRRAGVFERGEPQLHHRRVRHREHEDRGAGPGTHDRERPQRPAVSQMRPESVDDRPSEQHKRAADDQRWPERLPRVDDVGQLPAGPRPGRDPQQRDPDRRRVGLERQPDVGGGEPHRQDLEHQDDPGGDEHHGGGEEARHPRSQPANLPRCRPRGGFEVMSTPATSPYSCSRVHSRAKLQALRPVRGDPGSVAPP